MDPRARAYRTAGIAYFVLALIIVALTVVSPELAAPERRQDLQRLLVGLPILAVVAALIGWGDRLLGRRRGAWWQEKITMLISVTGLVRTLIYVANAAGTRPRLFGGFRLESIDPQPKMWINAILMAVITVLLVRASWWPRLRGQKRTAAQ